MVFSFKIVLKRCLKNITLYQHWIWTGNFQKLDPDPVPLYNKTDYKTLKKRKNWTKKP